MASNTIHPSISARQVSGYTSLGHALNMGGGAPAQSKSSQRRRMIPMTPYPISKIQRQPAMINIFPPIAFDYLDCPAGQGMSVNELKSRGINGISNMMTGAYDPVLKHTGQQFITLRAAWPGYEHVECAIPITIAWSGGTIIRAQLAHQIALALESFVEACRRSACTKPDWEISDKKIRWSQLNLVALHYIVHDVWQAELAVELYRD